MNKRHYEHTLPNIRGSLSNTYILSLFPCSIASPLYRFIMEELLRFTTDELHHFHTSVRQCFTTTARQYITIGEHHRLTVSVPQKNGSANKRLIELPCITLKISGINWHQSGTEWHRYGFFRPFPSP